MSAGAGTWLVRMKPRPAARLRLLCVPYAGVGPSAYRRWSDALPSDIEVGAVHLPGREGRLREPALTGLEPLIDVTAEGLKPFLDRPFALFGHSMGALVAFELARRFRAEGWGEPTHLFVSGRRAPQVPPRHPDIAHLPDAEFVEEIRRRYNGIPDEVLRHPDLLALLLPGLRADLTLIEAYVHRPGRAAPVPGLGLRGRCGPGGDPGGAGRAGESTRRVRSRCRCSREGISSCSRHMRSWCGAYGPRWRPTRSRAPEGRA